MENNKFIITINREAGSGGKEIAQKLGELLGIKVYGKEILASILDKYHLTEEQAEKIKAENRTGGRNSAGSTNNSAPPPPSPTKPLR